MFSPDSLLRCFHIVPDIVLDVNLTHILETTPIPYLHIQQKLNQHPPKQLNSIPKTKPMSISLIARLKLTILSRIESKRDETTFHCI